MIFKKKNFEFFKKNLKKFKILKIAKIKNIENFDQVGLSVGHECLSLRFSSELVLEPQLDQKKLSTPSFLHCRAQSESKGPFLLNLSA